MALYTNESYGEETSAFQALLAFWEAGFDFWRFFSAAHDFSEGSEEILEAPER